jgi:hypothetical protein
MAASTGYNPNIIGNFTKITDLGILKPGKNYLATYFLGRPRQHHIAKFIEVKEEDGEPTYFFHSLYTRTPAENARWIRIGEPGYLGRSIGFDDETIRIKPGDLNTSPDPKDISKWFSYSLYELGPQGDLISELLRPEDVNSNVRGHMRNIFEPKTNPDTTNLIMGFVGKQGGKIKSKLTRKIKRTTKKSKKQNKKSQKKSFRRR